MGVLFQVIRWEKSSPLLIPVHEYFETGLKNRFMELRGGYPPDSNSWVPFTLRCSAQTQKNRWNEISKLIFYESGKKIFRTAKQCRERWNNYLDPAVTRGAWTDQEDRIIICCSAKFGKRWALISKFLNGRRTEHMVKNRYKSLITRHLRTLNKFASEASIIKQILAQYGNTRGSGSDLEGQIGKQIDKEGKGQPDTFSLSPQQQNYPFKGGIIQELEEPKDQPRYIGSPTLPSTFFQASTQLLAFQLNQQPTFPPEYRLLNFQEQEEEETGKEPDYLEDEQEFV